MNHAYRVLWSDSRRAHVAVPETARANGKGGKSGKGGGGLRARCLIALLASLGAGQLLAAPPPATALPEGGRVTAGVASISQSGVRMDVTQTSERAVLEWTRFDIGSQAQVNFAQPSASSVALNRVLAGEASQIYGRLTANGQVWLINPAGVMFGPGSRVDVGGLVASTLDTLDADFLAGKAKFQRNGATGKIVNQGEITASDGGLLALLAPEVRNEGVITARLGNVVLAAGERVTLDAGADGFLKIAVDPATVSALVDNRHLIQADGGQVLMSAQAADRLLSAVVANSGTVQARTLENRAGRILLLADMDHGEVRHDGLLDASAPTTPSPLAGEGRGEEATADGGFIETSAAKVGVGDTARVTTLAANGRTGTWLIDPRDFTIGTTQGGGGAGSVDGAVWFGTSMSGADLATLLGNTNITITTYQGGDDGGNGDIFVNDAVSWSANTTLSLQAERDIRINANLTATGNTAGLTLGHGAGRDYYLKGAKVTLSGTAPTLKIGTAGAEDTYIVINSLGVAGDATTTTLQGMKNNLTGKYALGSDIDASATAGWNAGQGFEPIGASGDFSGTLTGLGHVIDALSINDSRAFRYVGLFRQAANATFRNFGMTNADLRGSYVLGGIVASCHDSFISDLSFSGTVSGQGDRLYMGGLVGSTFGGVGYTSIARSSVTGAVTVINGAISSSNNLQIGGLVGSGEVLLSDSYNTATITGFDTTGGLIGYGGGTITRSYNTGVVQGATAGGLIGSPTAGIGNTRISDSYNTGSVTSLSTGIMIGVFGVSGSISTGRSLIFTNIYTASTENGNPTYRLVNFYGLGNTEVPADYAMLTSAQLKQQSSFAGWDFANTWKIYEGNSYPLLKTFLAPMAVTADNVTKTYDGNAWAGALQNVAYSNAGALASGHLFNAATPYGTGGGRNAATHAPQLYSDQQGYDISYTGGTLTVNQKALTLTGFDAANKVYDGNTTATIANAGSLAGVIGVDVVTAANGGASFADKNVGTGKTVTLTGIALTGADASNYSIAATATDTADITAKALTLTGFDASNKVYDGSTTVTIANAGSLSGVIGADVVTVSNGGANFADTNVGAGKTVTLAGITLGGAGAGNYSIAATATDTADITAKALTLTGFDAAGKVYDGNTTATIANAGSLAGVIGADVVTVSNGGANFADRNVGAGKTVTLSGIALGGAGAGNYSIAATTTDTADITAKQLSVGGTTTVSDKTYDSTTAATVSGGTVSGVVGADAASLVQSGSFDTKDVGNGKTVTYANSLGGGDAGNYSLSSAGGTATADIIAKALSIKANDDSKTQNGTPYSGGNGVTYTGLVSSETAAVLAGSLAYGGTSQGASAIGSYVISPSGLSSTNYAITFADGVLSITAVPPAPTFTPGQPDGGQLGRMAAAEPGNGGSAAIVVLPAAGDTGSIANLSFGGNFIRLPGE